MKHVMTAEQITVYTFNLTMMCCIFLKLNAKGNFKLGRRKITSMINMLCKIEHLGLQISMGNNFNSAASIMTWEPKTNSMINMLCELSAILIL